MTRRYKKREELTATQWRYLRMIEQHQVVNERPPTLREIAASMSVSVPSVQNMLTRLRDLDTIVWERHKPRTLSILIPVPGESHDDQG